MILATVRMVIPPSKHGEVLKILRTLTEQNRIQPGCLSSHIYRDTEEGNTFSVEETWRSKEDLECHLRSAEYSKLLQVMEMGIEHPEIRFSTLSTWGGIETIEKARGPIGKEERP